MGSQMLCRLPVAATVLRATAGRAYVCASAWVASAIAAFFAPTVVSLSWRVRTPGGIWGSIERRS